MELWTSEWFRILAHEVTESLGMEPMLPELEIQGEGIPEI